MDSLTKVATQVIGQQIISTIYSKCSLMIRWEMGREMDREMDKEL